MKIISFIERDQSEAALLAALLSFGVSLVNALPEAQVKDLRNAIARVPVLELAPKAAGLVTKTSKKDRIEVAVAVTRIVLSKSPTLAPGHVEAISLVALETRASRSCWSRQVRCLPPQSGA